MSINSMIKEAPKTSTLIKYKGTDFSINLPSNWKVQQVDESSTYFFGPKVGKLKLGFYINYMPKKGKTYIDAAKLMKASQSKEGNFTVLEEADISKDNFKAYMRRVSWYNKDEDMTLFVRNIFTETNEQVIMLSSSIPNNPDLATLDKAIIAMMNSFRFNQAAIA